MIDIALCTDNNYAMPAGVMIYSVCKNSGPAAFHIIVPNDFTEENRNKLCQVINPFGATISFIPITEGIAADFPVHQEGQPEHISIAAYYRLFLADLLHSDIDKLLYLDCDILCMSSLNEFWNTDIENKPLAGISDIPFTGVSEATRLGYDEKNGYFNSGVLLINLAYWREHNVRKDFIDFIHEHNNIIRYHDQDVLNCVFNGKVLFCSPKYNAQDRLFHKYNPGFPFSDEEVEEARLNPVFVHFTYKNKPWILGGTHPYQSYFNEYKAATPWKNTRLMPKKASSLKGHMINALVLAGLYKYHDDYINITR